MGLRKEIKVLDKLKMLGDLKKLRARALAIQKKLAQIEVEVDREGVAVIASGDQRIKSLQVEGEEKEKIREAVNQALKKAQEKAAQEMGGVLTENF